ncbi:MAG: Hsp20/alpha crystallin family protein [Acidobacteriota bacterium]
MARPYPSLLLVGRLQGRLNQVFQEVLEAVSSGVEPGAWQPAVDVVETPREVLLLVELPGVGPGDIEVEVRGTTVILRGERRAPRPRGQRLRFLCVETGRGRFTREVQIQQTVNGHRASATLRDGLLIVAFPKVEEQRHRPRRVEIEESS